LIIISLYQELCAITHALAPVIIMEQIWHSEVLYTNMLHTSAKQNSTTELSTICLFDENDEDLATILGGDDRDVMGWGGIRSMEWWITR
jgi:hypothetical protein